MARNRPVQVESLYREIRTVLDQARASAYRAVNAAMVRAYWQVGHLIVEHEQGGRRRAGYGEGVLEDLSRRLTKDFGHGFDVRNLRYMRQFYLAYPASLVDAEEAGSGKRNALRSEFDRESKRTNYRDSGKNSPGRTIGNCSASKMRPRAGGI